MSTTGLFIHKRLIEKLSLIKDYPLTAISAPEDYPVLDALDSFLSSLSFDKTIVKLPKSDDDNVLWRHIQGALSLEGALYPFSPAKNTPIFDNSAIDKTCRALKHLKQEKPLFIILHRKHYILLNYAIYDLGKLLSALNPNVHIIIIIEKNADSAISSRILTRQINGITEADFNLSASEINELFMSEGITPPPLLGEQFFQLTGGVLSEVYLRLIAFRTEKRLCLSLLKDDIIFRFVWQGLDRAVKNLLVCSAMLESFSAEALIKALPEFAPEHNTQKLLHSFINKFPYLVISSEGKHRFISYFQAFLSRFWKCAAYANITDSVFEFLVEENQILQALSLCEKCGKPEKIYTLELSLSMVYTLTDADRMKTIENIYASLSEQSLAENPDTAFVLASITLVTSSNPSESHIAPLKQIADREGLSATDERLFKGNYAFLKSLVLFNNIQAQATACRRALDLLEQPTSLAVKQIQWTLGCPSVFMLYHSQADKLDEEAIFLSRYISLYNLVSGGGGTSIDAVFAAEAEMERGNFQASGEILDGFYDYPQSETNIAGAVLLIIYAKIKQALFTGDFVKYEKIISGFNYLISKNPTRDNLIFSELTRSEQYSLLRLNSFSPSWISEGKFSTENHNKGVILFAQISYLRSLLIGGKYSKAFINADELIHSLESLPFIMPLIYAHIIKACASSLLGDIKSSVRSAEAAMILSKKDGILLPFAEYLDFLENVFRLPSFLNRNLNTILKIRDLSAEINRGISAIKSSFMSRNSSVISEARVRTAITEVKSSLFSAKYKEQYNLSDNEITAAGFAAAGKTDREIAEEMKLPFTTVQYLIRQVLKKLGLRTRKQLKQFF